MNTPEEISKFVNQARLLNAPDDFKRNIDILISERLTNKEVTDRLTDCVIKLLEGQKLETILISKEDMENQSKTEVELELSEKGFKFTIKSKKSKLSLI